MTSINGSLMKPTFLTNQLAIKFSTLPAETQLEITEKAIFRNEFYLALRAPIQAVEQDNFRLKTCFEISKQQYCIISYPQEFDDEQFQTALIVLKVISADSLLVISQSELEQITENCRQALASGSDLHKLANAMLGEFVED